MMDGELNPFDSSRIAPGARRFSFASANELHDWWQRFAQAQWRGAIIGPHGSGKTTLLRELLRPVDPSPESSLTHAAPSCEQIHELQTSCLIASVRPRGEARFQRLQLDELLPVSSGFQRHPLGRFSRLLAAARGRRWLMVDGYEQLNGWQRWRLENARRRWNFALTVTSHAPVHYTSLVELRVDMRLAAKLLAEELGAEHGIPMSLVEELLRRHDGNWREAQFALYDWWKDSRASQLET